MKSAQSYQQALEQNRKVRGRPKQPTPGCEWRDGILTIDGVDAYRVGMSIPGPREIPLSPEQITKAKHQLANQGWRERAK